MEETPVRFSSVEDMLLRWHPQKPVYCIYPHVCRRTAQSFFNGFHGRVLYAVKANDEPSVLRLLHQGGVKRYDCASVPEIELVNLHCPDSTCYFMVPALLRGAAARAQQAYGGRHWKNFLTRSAIQPAACPCGPAEKSLPDAVQWSFQRPHD
ncbi:MAG: hypothetical protein GWP58_01560 [Gammaproteobacteria bacterium]|jgi:ornithine decarboxylase|nr:hypothetical protein [Gammaproteobacteria bacterium]